MVRVLFVAAPFKHAFFLKMIRSFSDNVESMVVVPSYPQTSTTKSQRTALKNASRVLVADERTRAAITKFNPDVVYSDSPLYGSQLKVSQYIANLRIPTIVHLRGDLWREFFGWMRRAPIKSKLLGSPVYFSSMLGLVLADKITPICRWLEREVLRHLPSKPTEVVYQGVDPDDFFPGPRLGVKRPAVAIIQNHTVYEKTLGLLMFAKVVEKLPNIHVYIATGEDVKQSYLPLVKAKFSHFKNVHFLSGIRHPDGVRRLLTSSDLYVLPSCLDCCPTTVLEASLMERPVLGSRVGGIPEIISDGYTGWSVVNEDTDEWVKRIQMLTEDGSLSSRLGMQGRRWVSKNFGWAKIAPQVERLIISEAGRRR